MRRFPLRGKAEQNTLLYRWPPSPRAVGYEQRKGSYKEIFDARRKSLALCPGAVDYLILSCQPQSSGPARRRPCRPAITPTPPPLSTWPSSARPPMAHRSAGTSSLTLGEEAGTLGPLTEKRLSGRREPFEKGWLSDCDTTVATTEGILAAVLERAGPSLSNNNPCCLALCASPGQPKRQHHAVAAASGGLSARPGPGHGAGTLALSPRLGAGATAECHDVMALYDSVQRPEAAPARPAQPPLLSWRLALTVRLDRRDAGNVTTLRVSNSSSPASTRLPRPTSSMTSSRRPSTWWKPTSLMSISGRHERGFTSDDSPQTTGWTRVEACRSGDGEKK